MVFSDRALAALLVGALAFTMVAPASASTTYGLSDDFSLVSNPNGVWSYNQGNSPLTTLVANWGGVTGETFWTTTPTAVVPPAWTKAVTAFASGHDWQPSDVIGHSTNGIGSTPANVRWTAPAAGTISIGGRAWDAQIFAGREVDWVLTLNGTTLASHTGVRGLFRGEASAQFTNNIAMGQSLTNLGVASGDVLEFRLDTTTSFGHFVGVDLTVVFEEIPAPGVGVAMLPLVALGARRRRA